MIAVDSNVLVYAHREDSPWHDAAYDRIAHLAEGQAQWAIPWPCIHEFLAIVTHSRIYSPPSPMKRAVDQVEAWMESPGLVLLSESEHYWQPFRELSSARFEAHTQVTLEVCALRPVPPMISSPEATGWTGPSLR